MDVRQLRSFVAVAEESHFTRAAERLGIKQSSLSSQVRLLEQEVGLPLFDRTTRRVALTDAGVFLLTRARDVIAQIDDTTSELRGMKGDLQGHVRIGLTTTIACVDVIGLLAHFHRRHPLVELAVVEDLSVHLAGQLRSGTLDIGILSGASADELRGLNVRPFASEELVVIVPKDHRLAHAKRVGLEDLRDVDLVLPPTGATIRSSVETAAKAQGWVPRVVCESVHVERMTALVAAHLGLGVLPRSDAQSHATTVAVIDLGNPSLAHDLSICWRSRRTFPPQVRALLDHARELLGD
ncbi:MAG TPA: LysR family transcriptional regulator [Solirubrobacteraceae bacterium]|jgi:DNA-binding transcriptional LysR family regulator|nr:LysR family transcriptional regulator [Solirubrobacteraceae bacterium]